MISMMYGLLGIFAVAATVAVVLAGWYDLRMRRQALSLPIGKMRYRTAIIVEASRNLTALITTTASIKQNPHQIQTIVVSSHQNIPSVRQFVRRLNQQERGITIRYYAPRHHLTTSERLIRAYQTSPKHDFVLTLDAGDLVSINDIHVAVTTLKNNPLIGRLRFARHTVFSHSLMSLLAVYINASVQMTNKSLSVSKLICHPHHRTHCLSRHSSFIKRHPVTTRYCSSPPITTGASRLIFGRTDLLSWLFSALASTFVFITIIHAVTLHGSAPLLLLWVTIMIWLGAAVWSGHPGNPKERIQLSYGFLVAPLLLTTLWVWRAVSTPIIALSDLLQMHVWQNVLALATHAASAPKTWYRWQYPPEYRGENLWRSED